MWVGSRSCSIMERRGETVWRDGDGVALVLGVMIRFCDSSVLSFT